MRLVVLLVWVGLTGCSGPLAGVPAPSRSVELGLRLPPIGLAGRAEASWRHVYREDDSPLWDGLYVEGGGSLTLSGAYVRPELHAQWLPIGLFRLRVGGGPTYYFGEYGSVLSFPSADAPYGDDVFDARDGDEETGWGRKLYVRPTLRARIGRVVAQSTTDLSWYDLPGDGPFVWETDHDILIETRDLIVANRTGAGYVFWEGDTPEQQFTAGANYYYVRAQGSELVRRQVGLFAYWSPPAAAGPFQQPWTSVVLQYNVRDPAREEDLYLGMTIGAHF